VWEHTHLPPACLGSCAFHKSGGRPLLAGLLTFKTLKASPVSLLAYLLSLTLPAVGGRSAAAQWCSQRCRAGGSEW
jgi:hypothetical protein